MRDVLSSTQDLGEKAVDWRELGMRKKVNWRVWINILNIGFVSNGAFPTKVFPKTHFELQNDNVEEYRDHKLTHFYSGVIPGKDSYITNMCTRFR